MGREESVKLIVGLGNPGMQYRLSRHNMGFLVLDRLAEQHDISIIQKNFNALLGHGKIENVPVLLAKPQCYMNRSGKVVKALKEYFKIGLEKLIVIHDDLDLPFETFRLKVGGGHGGHKGLISIIDYLGESDFIRVRLGIGKPAHKEMVEEYVLESFSAEEIKLLSSITSKAGESVAEVALSGIQAAMCKYHVKT
jgi:PTH1 family peptidyl-tRNA hydrolase